MEKKKARFYDPSYGKMRKFVMTVGKRGDGKIMHLESVAERIRKELEEVRFMREALIRAGEDRRGFDRLASYDISIREKELALGEIENALAELRGPRPGRIIEVEGFKAFFGMMDCGGRAVWGEWLYKSETDCWYCRGSSYPADMCRILSVE